MWLQFDQDSLACKLAEVMPGAGMLTVPVDIVTYNIDALVEATAVFLKFTAEHEAFASSFMLWEQYATQAVRAADTSKSAIPWRQAKIVM